MRTFENKKKTKRTVESLERTPITHFVTKLQVTSLQECYFLEGEIWIVASSE